ncbi:PREDICTED: periphilin-1 isoform X1 [Thamnophis sirtalis]|uniref:Periphilin-1 isoform X1 n=2 Tax=Thamnophis TaxID=34999 RepID=A0A6I9XQ11_9SAUR|nr:PREDICTED: periphilin-1 isoform X1 [Thamnophis sirtalis]XP_032077323.1 periphilin-1 isoform X2 [Thamnophis elegans]XP_032077324.1 periphilin-1 isoform X2 [Thamnophis elegans]XP_032077325.1 periphilin-1 isoform X2 [Thamnophis elegans]XP_032077326.1 periphilin-1 isoform X2 [Thamnophis elegans]XP_032077327.1 periphilin-1 isoform X2 [Thamnophis elegans]
MWSERYEYERLPRERLPPRPDDDYHRVVSFASKKPPLTERPGEGGYSRYEYGHAHVGYRDYDEGRGFAPERRSGLPHRIDDPGYRWSREDHSDSRPPDYRDGIRRKPIYPQYARDRSPHKRDSPYFRESPIGRRESPHSRSGSSVSSRSYSPDRSKAYTFHQSQHSRSMSSLHKRNISLQERSSTQSLKTSRDVSPSGATALPPAKTLDKSNRLSEKELAEAASRWAAEKAEKVEASSVPEISEYDATSSDPLYIDHHEETGASITDSNQLFEDNHHLSRSKAIAQKTKEIEQVYRQDCETFGAVVKMLIEKDPTLEKPVQFSLRQNLHEIGERCVEELKHFIAEYDSTSQEFEET